MIRCCKSPGQGESWREVWDGELALMHYPSRGILGACGVFFSFYKSQIFIIATGSACIVVLI